MKASQVIRAALNSNYTQERSSNYGPDKTAPFMCHAIEYHLTDDLGCDNHENSRLVERVIETFMVKIEVGGKRTLCDFMYETDPDYKQAFSLSGSHYSEACYQMRVIWWKDHIAELEAKGL